MSTITIRLCGSTEVRGQDGAVCAISGVKPVRILEMLAVQQGVPLSKELIADRLWGDELPRSYAATLESYVSNLRRALGCSGRNAVLATTTAGYVLTAAARVDLTRVHDLLALAGRADGAEKVRRVEQALGLVHGELLAGEAYGQWAQQARSELDAALVEACTAAARAALDLGEHDAARRLARAAVDRDRLAEAAWQVLLEALDALGRRGEALAAYARFRSVVLEELGIEPSAETRAIYGRILAGCDDQTHADDLAELSALVRLLRQRLESWPGVQVPRDDHEMVAVALRMVSAA